MAETSKPDLNRVWAEGAPVANVEDPDVTSAGKFDAGWVDEVPPFENFNYLFQVFSQGLKHLNEQGVADWDIDTNYAIDGIVKGNDGKLYKSTVLDNTGTDPTTLINWEVYAESIVHGETTSAFGGSGALTVIDKSLDRRCAAFGYNALNSNTVGLNNLAVGAYTLSDNVGGSSNSAAGAYALQKSTGSTNSAFGGSALQNTTGNSSSALGYLAGDSATIGGNNSFIGYNAQPSAVGISNEITLGNSSITALRCQVTSITALSDRRDKTNIEELNLGLEFISKLKPVSFDWDMRDGGKVGEADTGFIAQDLKEVQSGGNMLPGLVYEENPEKLEAAYGKLLPVMVKAIQELTEKVSSLEKELASK